MRRRTPVCLAVVLAACCAGAGAATAKAPPAVRRATLVYGVGTAALDVTVPAGGVELLDGLRDGNGRVAGFATMTSATWSAVAIVARANRVGGRLIQHYQVHLPSPDHCPSATAPTVGPVPTCTSPVEQTAH